MNRMKKHRIKEEKPSTSRTLEDHDLAYFIHDRVELMHQVFSVLKSKELKTLAPECVRRLSIDDLQELCLEELLGISSKRLCAILDGAEPPSDTDSSSQSAEQMETISLDSISSDEEILSQSSKKKKHKHRHSKKKRRKKSKGSDEEQGESRASRAGLTVLELLELQARARAIRAQLHQEPAKVQEPVGEQRSSDNDEVLIKEEPAEVVEISSDEEKPDVARLQKQIDASTSQTNVAETNKNGDAQSVTKRINDLIITVPQSKPTRKIKLKRQKPAETVTTEKTVEKIVKEQVVDTINTANSIVTSSTIKTSKTETIKASAVDNKNKSKKSKKKKQKAKEKRGSDEDEITIQLSDSEKMDLLEDLDAKTLDTVTSNDSDSSSDSEDNVDKKVVNVKKVANSDDKTLDNSAHKVDNVDNTAITSKNNSESTEMNTVVTQDLEKKEQVIKDDEIRGYVSNDYDGTIEINDLPVIADEITTSNKDEASDSKADDKQINAKGDVSGEPVEGTDEEKTENNSSNVEENRGKPESCQETKSDGEISDRESSEVEASDVQPEVVCVSDDNGKKKKKKKKEKKKSKKTKEKTKSVFREEQDENFYKENKDEGSSSIVTETIDDDDDDVYEYLEISDDSSCYEVEGVSVLSKEPTAEEIEAFSARMDEIDIDRVETIVLSEDSPADQNEASDIENISWKDRYLGSKKVKRVLTTSNILNAIRKKNRELKKKLEEAKKTEKEKDVEVEKVNSPTLEDGTIEQYETLLGSTKYVDPVKEPEINVKEVEENEEGERNTGKEGENTEGKEDTGENVTKEMKKDAKMLLKMYKRLLKYNDITKQKDPNKKKKKKRKKSKDKDKVASNT